MISPHSQVETETSELMKNNAVEVLQRIESVMEEVLTECGRMPTQMQGKVLLNDPSGKDMGT